MMDKKKVLASKVPHVELFGVGGLERGRPAIGTAAFDLLPKLEMPVGVEDPRKLRGMAFTRAMTVLRAVFAKEFRTVYSKELDYLVASERGMSREVAPVRSVEEAVEDRTGSPVSVLFSDVDKSVHVKAGVRPVRSALRRD
jgi:hypothetical protein